MLKKDIFKSISIVLVLSLNINLFAGNFFKYNSRHKLILPPPDRGYKTLSKDDRDRFKSILKDISIKRAIGEKFVEQFLGRLKKYTPSSGWMEAYERPVQSNMNSAISKLNELQNDSKNVEIFRESRLNEKFNFEGEVDPVGIPEFCTAYPRIAKLDMKDFYEGDDRLESGIAYSGCYAKEKISISIKKIVQDFSKINDSIFIKHEKKAHEQIMITVSNAMLDQRMKYKNILDNYPRLDLELKRCLKEKSSKSKKGDDVSEAKFPNLGKILDRINHEEKTQSTQKNDPSLVLKFNNRNVKIAIIAKNIFDKRDSLMKQYRELLCSENDKDCSDKVKVIKLNIGKQNRALQLLMNEEPTLFDVEGFDGNFFNTAIGIKPSRYMSSFMSITGADKLSTKISDNIINAFKAERSKKSLDDIIDEIENDYTDEIKDIYDKIKDNGDIKKSKEIAVSKVISKINIGLKAICKNEGESLEQYSSIFPKVLRDVLSSSKSKKDAVRKIETVQSGLCSLYRNNPPDKDKEPNSSEMAIAWGVALGAEGLGIMSFEKNREVEEGDNDNSDFKTERSSKEDEEADEVKSDDPKILPASRGNPVRPHYFKKIKPTIQIKRGTY